jgi:DNA-binding CsgD family transcriptional regulator
VLRLDRIKDAVEEIKAAAILGDGWEDALNRFAYASGAHGAVLMRNRGNHLVAAITTDEVAEAVNAFAAGEAPPNSRYRRLQYDRLPAFRVDHDDYTNAELARDPFYQEFLRAVGFFWHANVPLVIGRNDIVELSLKRRIQFGPYDRADAAILDTLVPDLLTASRLAKHTLDAEARGMARLLEQRGTPVFQLDSWGRVLSKYSSTERDPACPVQVIGRRLIAGDPVAQPLLERAIERVRASPRSHALVPLTGSQDRRYFLQLLSVPGRAREVFLSAAALAVLIDAGDPPLRIALDAPMVAHAFALTDREADVACLLAEGMTIAAVARTLGIQTSTARVHLRSIFEKTGTNRQAELVAMLGRLRP